MVLLSALLESLGFEDAEKPLVPVIDGCDEDQMQGMRTATNKTGQHDVRKDARGTFGW